ncbi:DUF3090 domain-containing protein [soil metagenome]
MATSFDFDTPDHFTAGAVGQPGSRVFYLQAGQGAAVVSLRLEKQQVAALAEYLSGVLEDLPEPKAVPPTDLDLVEPVVAEWVVGTLGVAYDEDIDRVVLLAEELGEEEAGGGEDLLTDEPEQANLRLRLTREQVAAFIERTGQLVEAGRPPCPICGRPLDPEGHVCPHRNRQQAH